MEPGGANFARNRGPSRSPVFQPKLQLRWRVRRACPSQMPNANFDLSQLRSRVRPLSPEKGSARALVPLSFCEGEPTVRIKKAKMRGATSLVVFSSLFFPWNFRGGLSSIFPLVSNCALLVAELQQVSFGWAEVEWRNAGTLTRNCLLVHGCT